MPSFCDFYSLTLKSLSFFVSPFLCSTVRYALCVNLRICVYMCVCFCVYLCLFLCLPVFSLLSLCVLKCPLVSANHFWSISEIYGQFFPIIPASFQSLHHPPLYSPSVGSWIVCFSQEDTDEALKLCLIFFYIFRIIFTLPPPLLSLLSFHITSFCLYLLASFSSPLLLLFLLAGPTNRCGSLCGTNRLEAEGCLCPFSLITSHLCVHKQTNTAINLRAQCRLRGRGQGRGGENQRDGDRRRQSFVSFTLVHEAGHAICHVLSLLHH